MHSFVKLSFLLKVERDICPKANVSSSRNSMSTHFHLFLHTKEIFRIRLSTSPSIETAGFVNVSKHVYLIACDCKSVLFICNCIEQKYVQKQRGAGLLGSAKFEFSTTNATVYDGIGFPWSCPKKCPHRTLKICDIIHMLASSAESWRRLRLKNNCVILIFRTTKKKTLIHHY